MSKSPYQLPDEIIFPDDQEDMRLDVALKQVFSALSLREIRRILGNHHIKINGQRGMKGSLVKAGDILHLIDRSPLSAMQTTPDTHPESAQAGAHSHAGHAAARPSRHAHGPGTLADNSLAGEAPGWGKGPNAVRIIKQSDCFVALFKPAGLHSAELKNRGGDSLEELLNNTWSEHFTAPPILLNRLDLLTSGIVLAAFSQEAVAQYQAWESARQIDKTYYALVQGLVAGELRLSRHLDMDSRIKTRVLDKEDPDGARHTLARPLAAFSGPEAAALGSLLGLTHMPEDLTLLKVTIQRGARHQIRAHLAAAGHPIVGDHLYGRHPGRVMYLHHAAINLPDFSVQCPPAWPVELLEHLSH